MGRLVRGQVSWYTGGSPPYGLTAGATQLWVPSDGSVNYVAQGSLVVAVQTNGTGTLSIRSSIAEQYGRSVRPEIGVAEPDLDFVGSIAFTGASTVRVGFVIPAPMLGIWLTVDSFTRDHDPVPATNPDQLYVWLLAEVAAA